MKIWKNVRSAYVESFKKNGGEATYYRKNQMQFLDPYIPLDVQDRVRILEKKNLRFHCELAIVSDMISDLKRDETKCGNDDKSHDA